MIIPLHDDFSELNQYLEESAPSKIFFLADENTHQYCLPTVLANLETEIPFEIIEIEAGEEMKVLETAGQLWSILAEFEADRAALLINVGGGVITDLGGFVVSTYKRGIRFINLPTTLLGMCDASIGGKTGIDHGPIKNLVGTFALPERIFHYPKFLQTLPYKELRSGFAEMLKHGLIADAAHWQALTSIESLTADLVAPHIKRSMEIKQAVVEEDFKEKNIRKTLNFGHTVGHAIESLFLQSGEPIPHGEAVAAGMICETKLAELEGLIFKDVSERVIAGILNYFPLLDLHIYNDDIIMSLMLNDKKNQNAALKFSLITEIGSCNFDHTPSRENLMNSLNFYRFLSAEAQK